MKVILLLLYLHLICLSFQGIILTDDTEIEKQATIKFAFPWSIKSTKVFIKNEGVLLINLFGSISTGYQWRLLNEDEIKQKWNYETLNLDDNKSVPFVMVDNISGSRKMHHKGVFKFLFKTGNTPTETEGEPVKISFAYSKSFDEENPEQNIDVFIYMKK